MGQGEKQQLVVARGGGRGGIRRFFVEYKFVDYDLHEDLLLTYFMPAVDGRNPSVFLRSSRPFTLPISTFVYNSTGIFPVKRIAC
jgi:hypothetical protein